MIRRDYFRILSLHWTAIFSFSLSAPLDFPVEILEEPDEIRDLELSVKDERVEKLPVRQCRRTWMLCWTK